MTTDYSAVTGVLAITHVAALVTGFVSGVLIERPIQSQATPAPPPTAAPAVTQATAPECAPWTLEWKANAGWDSSESPDCYARPAPELPSSVLACRRASSTYVDDVTAGPWRVAFTNTRWHLGTSGAQAFRLYPGSLGDDCLLTYYGTARRATG